MLEDPFLKHLLIAGFILVIAAALGKALEWIAARLLAKLASRRKATLDDRLMEVVRRRLFALSIIAGTELGIVEIRKGLTADRVTHLQILNYLEILLFVLLIVVLIRLVSRLVRSSFDWYVEDVAAKTQSGIMPTVAPLAMRIVNMILYLIAGMILLDHFGVNIGSLLVSLGVGSLAIALAAQETVANMIAGFVILADQPFRIGDRIKLPTGEEGDVHQIGLRSTRILNGDDNLLIIPNGELVKSRIVNYSFPTSRTAVVLDLWVALGTDTAAARDLMTGLAKEHPDVQDSPAPRVFVAGAGDSGIQLRLVCQTPSFRKKFDIETALREQILVSFARTGIEVAVPRRIVRLQKSDEPQADQKE
jgi:small-conductance mechanosensitive channel